MEPVQSQERPLSTDSALGVSVLQGALRKVGACLRTQAVGWGRGWGGQQRNPSFLPWRGSREEGGQGLEDPGAGNPCLHPGLSEPGGSGYIIGSVQRHPSPRPPAVLTFPQSRGRDAPLLLALCLLTAALCLTTPESGFLSRPLDADLGACPQV